MEDGEYRATFGKTWPMILPPTFMLAVAAWILFRPTGRPASPAATPIALCFAVGLLPMIVTGFWVWRTEYLALSGDGLGYQQTGKPYWHLNWGEIRAVRIKNNASVETPSATITLEYAGGERTIRDSFLPIKARELAKEISRRSGAPLSS